MKYPVASFQKTPTPFYYYDLSLLRQTLLAVKKAVGERADYKVHYALKANSNPAILKEISDFGLGVDTVSGGEIRVALENGFAPGSIFFAGVGKTDAEIEYALESKIGCFNVESAEELDVIESIAKRMDLKAPVALRVNPEIDAHTHHYITTGLAENKFGISLDRVLPLAERCVSSAFLEFKGLHFHIGSQITITEPFVELSKRILNLQGSFDKAGIKIPIINVGGGLGIDYENPSQNPIPDFERYFQTFKDNLPLRQGQELHFELGRSIVAQCGSLISRVLYVKHGVGKRFVILDAGMTDLIRPALYDAHHKIVNLTATGPDVEKYDVVGPICESSDVFGKDEILPETHRGDIFALQSAGAYGEVMASTYNSRPLTRAIVGD